MSVSAHDIRPADLINPVIDGEITSYFEWMGAGEYKIDHRQGAMHGGRSGLQMLYYGTCGDELYLRLDFDPMPEPARFCEFQAPALLREVDCRISVGACKWTLLNGRPLVSGCVKNLYGLLPRAVYRARGAHSRGQLHRPDVWRVLGDVHATLGPLFDGGVVDATSVLVSPDWRPHRGRTVALHRVFWGDSLAATDAAAQKASSPW